MKANDLIEKIQGFLLDPKNQFEKEKKTDLKGMLIYGGIGILVLSIISTCMMYAFFSTLGMPAELEAIKGFMLLITFFILIFASFFVFFVIGAWLHLIVYLMGAKEGITQTIKVIFYSATPQYYLAWIGMIFTFLFPNSFLRYIGILFSIWFFVLIIIGLVKLQKMPGWKAIVAIIIAMLPFIILNMYLFSAFGDLTSTSGLGLPGDGYSVPTA